MSDTTDDTMKQMIKDMVEKHKLTSVGIQRAISLYQTVNDIFTRYSGSLPDKLLEMERDIITVLAKEIDRNFYEGMIDTVTKAMQTVMKIPQVKEIQKQVGAEAIQKIMSAGGPEAEALQSIMKTLKVDFGQATAGASKGTEYDLESGLPSRVKKEDLN